MKFKAALPPSRLTPNPVKSRPERALQVRFESPRAIKRAAPLAQPNPKPSPAKFL